MSGGIPKKDSSALERAAAMAGNSGNGRRLEGAVVQQPERALPPRLHSASTIIRAAHPNESLGWRRSSLASLSTEELQALARQMKEKPTLSAEDAASRARLMSEQIDAITAGVRRRQHFEPVRKMEEEEKQSSTCCSHRGGGQCSEEAACLPTCQK